MDSQVRPVIIISTGRSGSSYTAKQFADAGFWHGVCRPGDQHNPEGYFENIRLKRDCQKLHGRDWASGAFPDEHPRWHQAVLENIEREGWRGEPWFFKIGAFYWKCFRSFDPVFVKVWRPREKILASYERLGWLSRRYALDEQERIIDRQHEAMREIPGMDVHIP